MTRSRASGGRIQRLGSVALLAAALAGCGTLPEDGPSTRSIPREAKAARYALVDLTLATTQTIAANPPAALAGLMNDSSALPNDIIAPGDTLTVAVFEPGGNGLFSSTVSQAMQAVGGSVGHITSPPAAGSEPRGTSQSIPGLTVSPDGALAVPFAGRVHVAGLRTEEAAVAIQRALRGRAVDPQVTVTVTSSNANSVSVLGEVRQPGRVQLAPHNDRLLDILAEVGGPVKPAPDLALAVYRGEKRVEVPLSLVMDDPVQNIRLAPEDRVVLLDRPRRYASFGALIHNDNTAMGDDRITLADAISRAGGLDTFSANAKSVLLFRFERPEVARALGVSLPPAAKGVPIVYRLNFRDPESPFVANNFEIQPDDLVYVTRSDIFEVKKFFDLVNSVTQIGYNARVTTSSAVP